MSEQRIREDDGSLTILGSELGRQRLEAFVQGHGEVQAMALFLVMAVTTAPRAHYSDEALDALLSDAEDLRDVANRWADGCRELAEQWRRQRQADEDDQ